MASACKLLPWPQGRRFEVKVENMRGVIRSALSPSCCHTTVSVFCVWQPKDDQGLYFFFFNSKLAQFSNTLPGHVLSNSRIGPPFNDKNENFGYDSILLRNV